MAEKKPATKRTKKAPTFSAEERAAMKERARELKAEADGEAALLAQVAEMKGSDRTMAKRLHAIVMAAAPSLAPKTWYGMPAYANEEGKVVCFFQSAGKFNSRYATFGFSDQANLDKGSMWPTTYALAKLTPAEEKQITTLVKRAVG